MLYLWLLSILVIALQDLILLRLRFLNDILHLEVHLVLDKLLTRWNLLKLLLMDQLRLVLGVAITIYICIFIPRI